MFDKDKMKSKIDAFAEMHEITDDQKMILSQFSDYISNDLPDLMNLRYGDLDNFRNLFKLQKTLNNRLAQELLSSKFDPSYHKELTKLAISEEFIPKRNSKKMETEWLKYDENI